MEDDAGVLWIGTRGAGLCRFSDGRFTVYRDPKVLGDGHVLALARGRDGLWIGTQGSGLARMKNGALVTEVPPAALRGAAVFAVVEGPEGSVWIGTNGAGLFRLQNGELRSYGTPDGLSDNFIYGLIEDRNGTLWVATTAGLNRFRDGRFESLTRTSGLPNDNVYSAFEDREGSLWLGTFGGGLVRLKDASFATFSRPEGLPHDTAWAVLEDRAQAVWVGMLGGGLARMAGGRVTTWTTKQGLPRDQVWALAEGADGSIWVGTDGGGLAHLKDGRFTTLDHARGLASNLVMSLRQARDGALWIGTDNGLQRLVDGRLTTWRTEQGLSGLLVRALLEARDGSLWIGTEDGGLSQLKDGHFRAITVRDGLGSNFVRSLHEDAKGALWVGTDGGGLTRIQGSDLHTFTTRDGLFDDVVHAIVEDGSEQLWLLSNRGVSQLRKSDLNARAQGAPDLVQAVAYGRDDGMRSSEGNSGSPAAWRAHDGRLWFATTRGVAVVDPARLMPDSGPPPVVIETLTIDNETHDLQGAIRLPPGARRFEIRYTALSLLAPRKLRFHYRLEGFDPEWIDAGTRRTAYYTNVPPGRYRFQVIAASGNGAWNREGASIEISLAPFFYQARWFQVGVALLALAGAWRGYRLRVRGHRQREAELVRLVEERTRQLTEANQTLLRLSRQDALTGIANRRQFDETLTTEWRRAQRGALPLGLTIADIDHFKTYNDRYGHPRGDECIKEVAAALAASLKRAGDLVARWGGEEFAILQPETDPRGSEAVAAALGAAVRALAIPHAGSPGGIVTLSLGSASVIPRAELRPEDLVAAADEALYRAKAQGRDRAVLGEAQPASIE
jgi:diguanylate cyclase (GGDEF)-like protein